MTTKPKLFQVGRRLVGSPYAHSFVDDIGSNGWYDQMRGVNDHLHLEKRTANFFSGDFRRAGARPSQLNSILPPQNQPMQITHML
jgi:hypothetical protein